MSRPGIVHVIHSLHVGGTENGLVNLINGLHSEFVHSVITMTESGALRAGLPPDVSVYELRKRPGHDLRAVARLVARLRRLRPAVVHSRNWASFDAVPAARLAGVPVVVHGEHGRESSDPEGRNLRRKVLRRMASPLVSRFVTVSQDLRRWLVRDVGIPAGKVTTICNGVDTDRFIPIDSVTARAGLGLAPDQVIVGTVGRLDPVKDQAGLLRAFAAVRSRCPGVSLVIAGDGPCRAQLEALSVALGVHDRVHLLGERHDVSAFLAALDIFVLPSVAEGISNTILEAMASGLPVIATAVGGNPELVENGVNGTLVPPQDPGALASAIRLYADDPNLRTVHGKSSRQSAVERFSLARMQRQYAQLYEDLIAARRRKAS